MAEVPPAAVPETTTVIVRPYPKIVYLYLTWIASVVCGVIQPPIVPGALDAAHIAKSAFVGRFWIFLFIFNILVISFEFTRIRSVAIVFALLAFIFAGIEFEFLASVGRFLGHMPVLMNATFYYVVAVVFTIIYLIVFLTSRFNYWEFQPNEILHHHGFLGDVQRYPTRGLRMQKEITDVLEHILLRAGTLVLVPTGVDRPIVLENVIQLNKVEDKIQRLLGTLKVRLDEGKVGGPD
jgi:hypothetical protein